MLKGNGMARNHLIIIGNGFDRHHGIPSKYSDFGAYLKTQDSTVYDLVEEYFQPDNDFWWEFETRLQDIDVDLILDHASNYLESYGADDWSDAYHHSYQWEIDNIVSGISSKMRNYFGNWIRSLPIPTASQISAAVQFPQNAKFLNFNYTETLEKTYGVNTGDIFHIHGCTNNQNSEIVLGHGFELSDDERHARVVDEDTDVRVAEGLELIDQYFTDTFKPTDKIITDNQTYFQSLNNIDEIWILGHSLSDVDSPYFYEILKHINNSAVLWKISYHRDQIQAMQRASSLGIDVSRAQFLPISKF